MSEPAVLEGHVEVLRQVPLFEECTDGQLDEIAQITTLSSAEPGEHLVRECEVGRELFIILDGHAGVEVAGDRIAELGPGDLVGGITLAGLRVVTVDTLTPMTMLAVHQSELEALVIERAPSIAHRMVTLLSKQFQRVAHRQFQRIAQQR